jgi:hypothetical protein
VLAFEPVARITTSRASAMTEAAHLAISTFSMSLSSAMSSIGICTDGRMPLTSTSCQMRASSRATSGVAVWRLRTPAHRGPRRTLESSEWCLR